MLEFILEETIARAKDRGRQKIKNLQQIIKDIACKNYAELKRFAENWQQWKYVRNQKRDMLIKPIMNAGFKNVILPLTLSVR